MLTHLRVHQQWLLLPERVALHEPSGTAVIADVHLGYSERRRRRGDAVPLPSVAELLAPLRPLTASWRVSGLVVAGDLFERGYDANLFARFREALAELQIAYLGLVPGNHDGDVRAEELEVHGSGYRVGGWCVTHDFSAGSTPAIVGHWHPALRLRGRKRPCFLIGPDSIVLPAFSPDAAGADVRRQLQWRHARVVAVVGSHLVEIPTRTPRAF